MHITPYYTILHSQWLLPTTSHVPALSLSHLLILLIGDAGVDEDAFWRRVVVYLKRRANFFVSTCHVCEIGGKFGRRGRTRTPLSIMIILA